AVGLADKRLRAEADAATHLVNPLPPGAVVRTDEGDEKAEMSEELRLGFAKALLPKIESSDPETAERIANAAKAMLGPIVRTDDNGRDDENLKNKVTGQGRRDNEPEDKERHIQDDDDDEKKGGNDESPTMRQVMDALQGFGKRLDSLEKRGRKDDDDD